MRYYDIQITNADGSKYRQYTSLLPTGWTDPGALNVEMDISQVSQHEPAGNALVRIWGLSLQDFSNATNFNKKNIKVFGGMEKGLPLANPAQKGLLVQGEIQQGFGNWIETEMVVTFVIVPGSNPGPLNIVLNWKAGTTLASALKNTFNVAYPGIPQNIALSANLVLNYDQAHVVSALDELAMWLNPISKSIVKTPGYPGVVLAFDGNTVLALDQANPKKTVKAISLSDLMGQPIWIAPNTIQSRVVMRGDLNIQDLVTLPKTPITTTAAAFTNFQDATNFSGNFIISYLRHVGNYRQPDGASWNTTMNMYPEPTVSA